MPRVSRNRLDKNISKEINLSFIKAIASLKRDDEIEDFLVDFLTKEEKLMLAKRLAISLMLEKGYTTMTICTVLKVSRETVRLSRALLDIKGGTYRKILTKLKKAEENREFWRRVDKILDIATFPMRPDRKSRARWSSGSWIQE